MASGEFEETWVEKDMKLNLKISARSVAVVVLLLSLALLIMITSCSRTSDTEDNSSSKDTATTTEDTSQVQSNTATDKASAATLSPDAAFDPLLPTLRQMTAAPIRLPASLPPQLKSVAIGNDPNNEGGPYTTGGDNYTILFLNLNANPPPDPAQIVQPYARYKVSGTLTASPASDPPQPDPRRLGTGGATVYQLGNVALPDGTVAELWRVEPPQGANYTPFTVGTFEEEGERYTLSVQVDTAEGDLVRQILSTMMRVLST